MNCYPNCMKHIQSKYTIKLQIILKKSIVIMFFRIRSEREEKPIQFKSIHWKMRKMKFKYQKKTWVRSLQITELLIQFRHFFSVVLPNVNLYKMFRIKILNHLFIIMRLTAIPSLNTCTLKFVFLDFSTRISTYQFYVLVNNKMWCALIVHLWNKDNNILYIRELLWAAWVNIC